MKEIAPADSAGKPPMRRGVYGKRELRVVTLPPAWQIRDRKSFMAARALSLWAILRDLTLSGRDKAVLAVCIHHMNPNEQWSCFASIPKIAEESGVSESGCWKAIKRADGKHIATQRRGKSTYITLYPNVAQLRPLNGGKIAELRGERSQNCEHNSYTDNSIKEGSRLKEGQGCKVFIETETPQWRAWWEYRKQTERRGIPQTDHRVCGILKRGWWLPAEWPPTHKQIQAQ